MTLTLAQYEQMVADGVFEGPKKSRIELIRGRLVERPPMTPLHAEIVDRINKWSFTGGALDKVRVRVHNPIALAAVDSEPEPGIVWANRKSYRHAHPTAEELLLVIEVAQANIEFYGGEKAEIYAEAGIRDYWVVNLHDQIVEVFRDREQTRYRNIQSFETGDFIEPLAAPGVRLSIEELFASL